MATDSAIEWTDATALLASVAFGSVVPRQELARPAQRIEFTEGRPAATGTRNFSVWLLWPSSGVANRSMANSMVPAACGQLQIAWSVVRLIPVFVMHLLAGLEKAIKNLRHHQAMLINIAAGVRVWSIRAFNQNISIGSDGPTALPIWIFDSRLRAHSSRIAHYSQRVNWRGDVKNTVDK